MAADPRQTARAQGRLAASVVVATALGWLLLAWAGREFGWPVRYAILIDLAALAAFAWALIVLVRVWRISRGERS
jgi:predicted MFS family arabinose efflux permease